jgi:excisionase family DNA binding protein
MKAEISFTHEDLEQIRQLIREELGKIHTKDEQPKYYTREEAANILKISLPTLHAWTSKGRLRPAKINGRVLIAQDEISRLVYQSKK